VLIAILQAVPVEVKLTVELFKFIVLALVKLEAKVEAVTA
jgi:hypothetical protein